MNIKENNYSIAEVLDMLSRRELSINKEYQRGGGIWPPRARSYFIDTILTNYPFPKIYFYEFLDREADLRVRKELVDGQQRISSIRDFVANKFAISGESEFAGSKFSDLSDDLQDRFLGYTVSVDVIRNATKSDILEMFRRMNAYTLPLNDAEKRHSEFQGEFKWFVNELASQLSPFFTNFGVFTNRQIVRMADAELIADLSLSYESGLQSVSASKLRTHYKQNDVEYPLKDEFEKSILGSIDFIVTHLDDFRKTQLMKPYALFSLLLGLMHAKDGIPILTEQLGFDSIGEYASDIAHARQVLTELQVEHELKGEPNRHPLYFWGVSAGTNRLPRRAARQVAVFRALGLDQQSELRDDIASAIPEAIRP